jgi:hypothetical protein
VVLDVNVYLDVARYLGAPFTWERMVETARVHRGAPIPNPADPAIDSIRAIVACMSGAHPDGRPLSVWTSAHITGLIGRKAVDPTSGIDDPGLGWAFNDAQSLIDDLMWRLIDLTGGDTVGEVRVAYGHPPLDHEDGLVFATARAAGQEDAYIDVVCLTRDNSFRSRQLPGTTTVMSPAQWLTQVKSSQRIAAMKRMTAPAPVAT